ncbi:hypothetical protein TNCV_2382621 [Trichonephila clavipes]|nr:hypothetical protein TNCV_2382621 [Trichonephila clavipes]
MVSISSSPEFNHFIDFGSTPIPNKALCIAKGNLFNISLFGRYISKNLVIFDNSSTLRGGNTRLIPWHSSIDPYERVNIFVLACLHPPRSPKSEAVCRPSGKNQAWRLLGIHPEYNATTSGRGSNA